MMAWFNRNSRWALLLLALGVAALGVKQVIAIADHGFGGWLSGEGAHQSEWEVRGVIALLMCLTAGALVPIWRAGEAVSERLHIRRMVRAIRRERERRRRPDGD
jgi:hypothetical protein